MTELMEMLAILERRDATLLAQIERKSTPRNYTDHVRRLRLPLPSPC